MIDLVFCLHQRSQNSPYLMGLAAVYASIRAHTRVKLCLYVLHDDSVDGLSKSMLEQSLVPGDRLLFRHASSVPEAYE